MRKDGFARGRKSKRFRLESASVFQPKEVNMTDEEQAELDYLRWFASTADFGAENAEVLLYMQMQYSEETGRLVPSDWLVDDGE